MVNPENEDLIEKHLPSLLFETPQVTHDDGFLGAAMSEAARTKLRRGARPVVSGRWLPHFSLNIRGGGGGTFIFKEGSTDIGTLSGQQQFREAYECAIYMHGGRKSRVKEISSLGIGGEILLDPVDPGLRTNATTSTFVTERHIYDGWRWSADGSEAATAFYGKVLITELLNAEGAVNTRSGDFLDKWVPQFNTAKFDNVHASWVREESEYGTWLDSTISNLLDWFNVDIGRTCLRSRGIAGDRRAAQPVDHDIPLHLSSRAGEVLSVPTHDPWCQTSTFPTFCRVCGQQIFILSCTCGSSVIFDRLGWPWPQHVCVGRDAARGPASSGIVGHVDTFGDKLTPASHSLVHEVSNADRARGGHPIGKPPIEKVRPSNCQIERVLMVRDVFEETKQTKMVDALPAYGRKMYGLQPDWQYNQVTLVDNSAQPNQSFTALVPESLLSGVKKDVLAKVRLTGCVVAETAIWIVAKVEVIRFPVE